MPTLLPAGKPVTLNLSDLILDPRLQMREDGLDDDHAADIADAVKAGAKPPKPRVFFVVEQKCYYVTDGFHTVTGLRAAGKTSYSCTLLKGTWQDALIDAAAANQVHKAKKRSRADKERAVRMAIEATKDLAKPWADLKIAKYVDVSDKTVTEIRRKMDAEANGHACTRPKPKKAKPAPEVPSVVCPDCGGQDSGVCDRCIGAGTVLADTIRNSEPEPETRNSESEPAEAVDQPAKVKLGQVDWEKVESSFGYWRRVPDQIARTYPAEKGSVQLIGLERLLDELHAALLGRDGIRKRLDASQKESESGG